MKILEMQGVHKSYGDNHVINDLNLTVNQGELRCLLGPNGAGKTTTMDLVTGRQKIDGGSVLFEGEAITRMGEHDIARRGIARKFQVPAIFKGLTVEDNLKAAYNIEKGPFANMFKSRRLSEKLRYDEIIELIGFKDRLKASAGFLSHGETQWLEIGMVLMQDPKLLLMDEPTAGMTEQETYKTAQIFNKLKGSHTLVVVEHDMSFVKEIADIISVMHQGTMLAEGTIKEIENNQRVKEVYLGTEDISHDA
ncbi:MAG: urea ABC transporter ATP-binding protein UrtD [Pseudomonadales bacterium]